MTKALLPSVHRLSQPPHPTDVVGPGVVGPGVVGPGAVGTGAVGLGLAW